MLNVVEFKQDMPHGEGPARSVLSVSVAMVRPNPHQPRKTFDSASLYELADSIRQYGLLQPITVRQLREGFYELVAGERRLRAARLAGLTHIDALVVDRDEESAAVLAMVENLQRENLHFLEEAEGYYALIRDHGFTQEALAQQVGRTQSAIANKLRILKLSSAIKRKLLDASVSERHARALLRLPDEALQTSVLARVVSDGLTVKETEALIEKTLQRLQELPDAAAPSAQRVTKAVRDTRVFINSVKNTVREMRESGLDVQYSETEHSGATEIRLLIPARLTSPPTVHGSRSPFAL